MKRIPPFVMAPAILASLRTHESKIYPEPHPIAPESAAEIMRRLNWEERDRAIRKRRQSSR